MRSLATFEKDSVGHKITYNVEGESFKLDCPFFLEDYTEYIPLMAITGPYVRNFEPTQPRISGYRSVRSVVNFSTSLNSKYPGLRNLVKAKVGSYAEGMRIENRIYNYSELLRIAIDNFLKSKCNFYLTVPRYHSRTTYIEIGNSFFKNSNESYYLRSTGNLFVSANSIYISNIKDFVMTVVVPKSLIEYQKLYFLLNGIFDYKGLEFWIKKDFDTATTPYKSLRSFYRKEIKPSVINSGMRVVEKSNLIEELSPSINIPNSSLDEAIEWKRNIARKVLEEERESLTFNFQ